MCTLYNSAREKQFKTKLLLWVFSGLIPAIALVIQTLYPSLLSTMKGWYRDMKRNSDCKWHLILLLLVFRFEYTKIWRLWVELLHERNALRDYESMLIEPSPHEGTTEKLFILRQISSDLIYMFYNCRNSESYSSYWPLFKTRFRRLTLSPASGWLTHLSQIGLFSFSGLELYWTQLSRFHLNTETEFILRNAVIRDCESHILVPSSRACRSDQKIAWTEAKCQTAVCEPTTFLSVVCENNCFISCLLMQHSNMKVKRWWWNQYL
jgi:hypothetical protein